MESESPIRLMMNLSLFKAYVVFLCVLTIVLLPEAGPFVLILIPTMAIHTLPLLVANMLIYAIFADYFYRWHFEYSIAIPVIVAPTMWWIVGSLFPVGTTAVVAMITLPIASIIFMKEAEARETRQRRMHFESSVSSESHDPVGKV